MPRNGREEDTYTAAEAAKVLGVSRRHVLNLLHDGELEGFRETDGSPWKVFQFSVHALRDRRPDTNMPSEAAETPVSASVPLEIVRDLERQLGRLEGRIQISEVAESTLREQLERERQRADRLEAALEEERRKGFWRRLFGG